MMNFKIGRNKQTLPGEKEPEKSAAVNEEYRLKLDSIQEVVQQDKERIRENNQTIIELNRKLEEQSKQIAATPPQKDQAAESKDVNNGGQQTGQNGNSDQNAIPDKSINNTQATTNQSKPQSENQNSAAVETNSNKVMNDGIWMVANSSKEFKGPDQREPQKGYYVVSGTFIYRDFAEAEVKRLLSKGFKANWIFFENKQYNYVYILKTSSREQAIKKAKQIREGEIKDAWILQVTD
jgi:cell division septation protein DedD